MGTALIAIIGTIVGASVSYLFQRLNVSRGEEFARAERLRSSRIDAYSAYAEKLMDWRRSQVVRAMLGIEEERSSSADAEAIKTDNRRARAEAWAAFYKVKLLCDDPRLEQLAQSALNTTRGMKEANDRASLNARGDDVREHLARFLDAAAAQTVNIGPRAGARAKSGGTDNQRHEQVGRRG
jgi:hypothetical protein